jgi:regulating synaptic membrane exocytosis protein 2
VHILYLFCHYVRKLWSGALKLPHEHQFAAFVEGLGSGQLVGRQVLASPCLGDIQIGLREQHGSLEVEIVRARNLFQKGWYKTPPGLLFDKLIFV